MGLNDKQIELITAFVTETLPKVLVLGRELEQAADPVKPSSATVKVVRDLLDRSMKGGDASEPARSKPAGSMNGAADRTSAPAPPQPAERPKRPPLPGRQLSLVKDEPASAPQPTQPGEQTFDLGSNGASKDRVIGHATTAPPGETTAPAGETNGRKRHPKPPNAGPRHKSSKAEMAKVRKIVVTALERTDCTLSQLQVEIEKELGAKPPVSATILKMLSELQEEKVVLQFGEGKQSLFRHVQNHADYQDEDPDTFEGDESA